jgi:hypothetical protein
MLTLTAGTALIMWLGEQISEKGIGNGISLIIFAGIVVRLPSAVTASYTLLTTGEIKLFVLGAIIVMMVAVAAAVVLMQEGQGTAAGPPLVDRTYRRALHADIAFELAIRRGVPAHHWRFGNMPAQPAVPAAEVAQITRYVRELQEANGIE